MQERDDGQALAICVAECFLAPFVPVEGLLMLSMICL